MGQQILAELEGDGIDTSHVIVTPEGTSPFTYIIVDEETYVRMAAARACNVWVGGRHWRGTGVGWQENPHLHPHPGVPPPPIGRDVR